MTSHRTKYKQYQNAKYQFNTAFSIFNEYGIENCKIELMENYPCSSKAELLAREGHHQRMNDCVNKFIADRKSQEYYQDKRDKCLEQQRIYRQENPDKILEYGKAYYQRKKESLQVKYQCVCGSSVRSDGIQRHYKSLKHQQHLNSLRQEEPEEAL